MAPGVRTGLARGVTAPGSPASNSCLALPRAPSAGRANAHRGSPCMAQRRLTKRQLFPRKTPGSNTGLFGKNILPAALPPAFSFNILSEGNAVVSAELQLIPAEPPELHTQLPTPIKLQSRCCDLGVFRGSTPPQKNKPLTGNSSTSCRHSGVEKHPKPSPVLRKSLREKAGRRSEGGCGGRR